jgi:ABC-type lipoprotein release transport system permease subunit
MKRFYQLKKEYFDALRVGFFLALRQISRSNKSTTGLIIFVMVLTFLNLVVVSGLLVGLIAGSYKQFRESYSGEVIITSETGHSYIENSPALISYLDNHPNITSVSPRHVTPVTVLGTLNDLPKKNQQTNAIGIQLVGVDVEREEMVTRFSRFVIDGEPLIPREEGYALIGANMLKKYSSFADANIPGLNFLDNVDVGSRVRVTLGREDGTYVSKDFIIKGIMKSKIDEISTRMFISDAEMKRLLAVNQEQYQSIAVRTDYARASVLVAELKEFMGYYDARIQTTDEAIPSFLRDIETTMGVLGNALSSIALVVTAITIFIVIYINAITKRKFIGIMKGIGISPKAVQFSYVMQAMFYGVAGSIIGLIMTFGVLEPYFSANPIDFPFSDGILLVTIWGAVARVAILLVVTLFAGYIPAKLIIRKNTLDSILGR